jgi:HD superfamily phosphohydrolase
VSNDRVIRDPVHGYVNVPSELIPIVDHRLFQRLRRVSQTSLTSYVYPAATGSRFEHALGTMHLSRRAWDAIWKRRGDEYDVVRNRFVERARTDIPEMPTDLNLFGVYMGLAFQAAALLHDVGHSPFSHALEDVFRERVWSPETEWNDPVEQEVQDGLLPFHEYAGRLIAKLICDEVFADEDGVARINGVPTAIRKILDPTAGWAGALHHAIAGQIDVDRIDYLMRDSDKAAGSEFGSIDYVRLLDALELRADKSDPEGEGFLVRPWLRARSAVETLLIQRLQSYEYIHFHPRSVGFNLALRRCLERFLQLAGQAESSESMLPSLMRGAQPNLVYWDQRKVDSKAALGMWKWNGPQAGEQFPLQSDDSDQLVAKLKGSKPLRLAAMADVDDAAVLETLKRARLLTATAPDRYFTAGVKDPAGQLRTYADAALSRRKNFVSAWKSVDEYAEAATQMSVPLLEEVPRVLRVRAATSGLDPRTAELLTAFADRIEQAREDAERMSDAETIGAVIALNTLTDLLLYHPEIRDAIRGGLNEDPQLDNDRGIWDLAYTGGGPVERPDVQLFTSKGQVSMIERSPLAQAVWLTEERRMRLAVFFFFENKDFSEPEEVNLGRFRGRVREEVVARFPKIAIEAIKRYV